MRFPSVVCLLVAVTAACGSTTADRSKPSLDVATADLVPWVAAESDGKTITVYAGFRTGPALKPVGLAGDDTLAATIGGENVTLQTFAQFAGTPFRASPMLRDFSLGLGDGVYYAGTAPVKTNEPIDISVELHRASARGGPANVAKLRLPSPQKITSPIPASVAHDGKLEVCWDMLPHSEALPDFVNELGTYGLCTYGTTTFTSTAKGTPTGCQEVDYTKVRLNVPGPSSCEVTVFARFATTGSYTAPFHGSSAAGDGGKPLPPNGDAPIAWQFATFTTQFGR